MSQLMCTDNDAPVALLDRVSLVLDAFDGRGEMTLAEVVEVTGLPRSSAHRILEHLSQLRWVTRDKRSYSLGTRLMELGHIALKQDPLHMAARPHLETLHRSTGLVVHLAVLDQGSLLYREKLGGRFGAAVPTRIGTRRPPERTALGKALQAYAGEAGAEHDKIRDVGLAFERSESVPGYGCIAAPVGPLGQAKAAISLCGPLTHLPFDRERSNLVRLAASAVWRDCRSQVTPVLQDRTHRSRSYGRALHPV
ncbi:IclR family transcriptional regulator [Rhodococcus sp. P1Y]|uniref:IclR family transcriptional regulator n=1 Tax=Rhodococcus sp. P1Y TaxID=1302308 RepID=UPI001F3AFF80|nr:IclR family transcriptional regulator [Rhodococcus sp. P1Y]